MNNPVHFGASLIPRSGLQWIPKILDPEPRSGQAMKLLDSALTVGTSNKTKIMKNYKISSALLIVLIYLITTSFTVSDLPRTKGKWVTYKSETEKIKIKFPGEIIESDEELDDGAHHVNVKHQPLSGNMYMLDVIRHTVDLSESEDLAQHSIDAFFLNMGIEYGMAKEWDLKGNKGLQAKAEAAEMGVTIDYRVVMVGQQQIQAVVVMKSGMWDQKVVNKFFMSLKLLK